MTQASGGKPKMSDGDARSDLRDDEGVSGGTVTLRGVSKWFVGRNDQVQALSRVDLDISAGEFVSVIGPSGCGKSTLLRVVGGLIPYESGSVDVGGMSPDVARRTKQLGFTPQTPALLPWRTVRKNVRLLSQLNARRAVSKPLSAAESLALLETVGLGEFLDSYPNELSGGMQQRVSLVRTFTLGAPVMLMDEPFSALDEITRNEMRYLLLDMWARAQKTVIFVTHSLSEAVILADRVLVMAPRPGRVVWVENIDLPRPRDASMEDDPQFHEHVRRVRAALHEVSVQ
jgi:NitT/TauT family transport system ATP-binding protein